MRKIELYIRKQSRTLKNKVVHWINSSLVRAFPANRLLKRFSYLKRSVVRSPVYNFIFFPIASASSNGLLSVQLYGLLLPQISRRRARPASLQCTTLFSTYSKLFPVPLICLVIIVLCCLTLRRANIALRRQAG